MTGGLRGLGAFVLRVLRAGIWLSPVLPPEVFAYDERWRRAAGRPVPKSTVAPEVPAGIAPGHPERLSDTAPTTVERRLWADLGERTLRHRPWNRKSFRQRR